VKRGTRLLVVSNFVANLGRGLCWPYLGFRLYDIGATYLQIFLMNSLAAATYMLSRPWGALSDYYGRRKPFMLLGFTGSALPLLFMASFNRDIAVLLFAYLASCFSWALAFPAFVVALTSDPKKEEATTAFTLTGSLGWAVGTGLMGPVDALLGPGGLFSLGFIVFLAFPAILAFYDEKNLPRKQSSLKSYLKGALTPAFRAKNGFSLLLGAIFLSWLGLQWANLLIRIRVYDSLGRSKVSMGLLMGAGSLLSAAMLAVAGKAIRRLGGLRIFALSTACYTTMTPIYVVASDPSVFVVLWLLPAGPLFNLGYTLSPAELAEEDVRGEAVGYCEAVRNLGVLLGLLGGLAADTVGRETSLALSAIPLGGALVPMAACYRAVSSCRRATHMSYRPGRPPWPR